MTAHWALPELCTPFPGPMMPGRIEIVTVAFARAAGEDGVCAEAAPPMVAASTITVAVAVFARIIIRLPSRERCRGEVRGLGRHHAGTASRSRRCSPRRRFWEYTVVSNQVGKALARRLG